MTALEKAARALIRAKVVTMGDLGVDLDILVDHNWADWVEPARAVLMAVREPEHSALIAGMQEMPFGSSSPAVARRSFKVMIDDILNDGAEP